MDKLCFLISSLGLGIDSVRAFFSKAKGTLCISVNWVREGLPLSFLMFPATAGHISPTLQLKKTGVDLLAMFGMSSKLKIVYFGTEKVMSKDNVENTRYSYRFILDGISVRVLGNTKPKTTKDSEAKNFAEFLDEWFPDGKFGFFWVAQKNLIGSGAVRVVMEQMKALSPYTAGDCVPQPVLDHIGLGGPMTYAQAITQLATPLAQEWADRSKDVPKDGNDEEAGFNA